MDIDVVIPTGKDVIDSHNSICYTLRSILSQSLQPDNIYVVENVGNTRVSDIVKSQFGDLVQVIDGTKKTPNISYARNLGASYCRAETIIFMDDDVILGQNDYFARIVEIMKYNDFCCGARRYWTTTNWHKQLSLDYPMNHNMQILKSTSFLPQSIERSTGNRNCSGYSYIGNFGAIKREVFEYMEGFDETYEGWLYQDTDLMMRLCYHKFQYMVLAYLEMFCYHLSHPAEKQAYRQINKNKYEHKQQVLNIKFNNKHFFGEFEDNDFAVITQRR